MKPIIAINLDSHDYSGWVSLSNRTVASINGNIAFATPSPATSVVAAAEAAVVTAIGVWGPEGNRGAHETLIDLQNKTLTLANLVRSLAGYVTTTAAIAAGNDYSAMAVIMLSSGFELKSEGHPIGTLQMVQNFHQFVSRLLAPNQGELKWDLPLGVTKNNVDFYKVLRSTGTVFAAATAVATPSETKFIDTNTTGAVITYNYWCVAVAHGVDGVPSPMVTITLAA